MTIEEQLLDYANKAQSKITELADTIQAQLSIGGESPDELESAIELLDFQESLLSSTNPWSDADKQYWMEYFITKYNLIETPWVDTDIYVLPVAIAGPSSDGANYATVQALNSEEAARQNADAALADRITALEQDNSDVIPQSLIDDVAANKTAVADHEERIDDLEAAQGSDSAALATHIADASKHIQAGERAAWNAKVSTASLTATLLNFAAKIHSHAIADVTGLQGILNNLQNQINTLPVPEDGADGATPTISIGTVVEGEAFSVELDPTSTTLNPVLNFTLVKGDKGDGFTVDAVDNLAARSAYDAEAEGFAFLAQDTGDLYIMLPGSVWSSAIPFKGENGWTPRLGIYEYSSDKIVLEILGFFGGSGDEPVLDGGSETSPRFFLTNGGYTTIAANAINIKGRPGADGAAGRAFMIDAQGSDRTVYNSEAKGFTFYNVSTGKVSWKLSETTADWSAEYQWKGIDIVATAVSPNTVYAGPAVAGSDAIPVFRPLVAADIPELPYWKSVGTTDFVDDVVLTGNTGQFMYWEFTSGIRSMYSEFGGTTVYMSVFDDTDTTEINMGTSGVSLKANGSSGQTLLSVNQLNGIRINSTVPTFPGMTYQADHSANFGDRSIPDCAWVNSRPGLVTTDAQTFAGAKTFTGTVNLTTGNSAMLTFNRTGVSTSYGFEQDATSIGLYDYNASKYRIRADGNNVLLNESGGNVGIGTTSPNAPLQFSGTIQNRFIVLKEGANNDHQFIGFGRDAAGHLRYQVEDATYAHVWYAGASSTTSNELMRLTGDGKLGIGTTSPNAPLQFANGTVARKIVLHGSNNDHQFRGFGTASPSGADIVRYQSDDASVPHVWYAGTSSTTSTELMRLTGGGKLGIGGTPTFIIDAFGATGTNTKIKVSVENGESGFIVDRTGTSPERWEVYMPTASSDLRLYNGADRFTFTKAGTGTATDWVATSDKRLKENLRPVGSQLDFVARVSRLVTNYDRIDNGKNETGFIAQELNDIAPEYVNIPKDNQSMWSVNYAKMVVPLYRGVAELEERVKELELKLKKYESA